MLGSSPGIAPLDVFQCLHRAADTTDQEQDNEQGDFHGEHKPKRSLDCRIIAIADTAAKPLLPVESSGPEPTGLVHSPVRHHGGIG